MRPRHAPLLIEARRQLHLSQGDLGELLGSSRRTGQRWESGGSTPADKQLHKLASLVHSRAPDLAAEIAASGGSTLVDLGIVVPPSPTAPSSPRGPALDDIVDAVVCAAADAIDVTPRTIRPALLAAFRRVSRIGLGVEAVCAALEAADQATARTPVPEPTPSKDDADTRAAARGRAGGGEKRPRRR
jgi:DNA-binding XRE family transcriptional regulator